MRKSLAVLATVWLTLVSSGVRLNASDHADPQILREPNANITDLFFFPHGDQMILIFNVRRALTAPAPFPLEPYEYRIFMDLRTPLTFTSEPDRARYGGTVSTPGQIEPTVTIRFRLNDDLTVKEQSFEGLANTDQIRVYTGIRDDPFIFPRFFKRNAIATVMSIPMSSFPAGQQDFILWGATYKNDRQVDHVGRSNRTQQARFEILNTLPPSEHVEKIMDAAAFRSWLYNYFNPHVVTMMLGQAVQYLWQFRPYDVAPDVMIYTTRFPPGFPNGRQLTDDVAAITCSTGDCVLQDLSFIEGGWPRATVNDKPFLPDFPFLAEPWPDQPQPPAPSAFPASLVLLVLFSGVVLIAGLVTIVRWPFRLVKWYRNRAVTG